MEFFSSVWHLVFDAIASKRSHKALHSAHVLFEIPLRLKLPHSLGLETPSATRESPVPARTMWVPQPVCSSGLDNSLGPWAGELCRGGFDFTLFFEEAILAVPLQSILLLLLPTSALRLARSDVKVVPSNLRWFKAVSLGRLPPTTMADLWKVCIHFSGCSELRSSGPLDHYAINHHHSYACNHSHRHPWSNCLGRIGFVIMARPSTVCKTIICPVNLLVSVNSV